MTSQQPTERSGLLPSRRFWMGLILPLTVAVYGPSLGHVFQYDADWKVRNNPKLKQPLAYLTAFGRKGYSEDTTRLIPNLTFCLDYALFKTDPFGFHLTNLLVHLLNIFLVAAIGRAVLQRLGQKESRIPIVAAALFALHPLNSEAVIYCNARPNLIATSFYLLALICFLRAMEAHGSPIWTRLRRWALLVVTLIGALLSKELALTIVVMAPLLLLWLAGAQRGRHEAMLRQMRVVYVALALVGIGSIFLTGASSGVSQALFGDGNKHAGNGAVSLLLTILGQSRVLMHYFGLALLPLPRFLNVDHDVSLLRHQILGTGAAGASAAVLAFPIVCFVALAGVIVLAFFLRRKATFLSFFLLWPFITHAPTSLIPRREAMVEYRTYLPMVGVCLVFAWVFETVLAKGLSALVDRVKTRADGVIETDEEVMARRRRLLATGAALLGAALLAAAAAATAVRTKVWRSTISLWADAVAKSPQKTRPIFNLGNAYRKAGRYGLAKRAWQRTIELNPLHSRAHNQLGSLALLRANYRAAKARFARAVATNPANAQAHYNLAVAAEHLGDLALARAHYQRFVSLGPLEYQRLLVTVRGRIERLNRQLRGGTR